MTEPIVITVGGGKGGIGKSTSVANIGFLLSEQGFSVGFIDGDLGGANLHLCLGIRRPSRGIQDFISGKYPSLDQVALPLGFPRSWLISAASDILDQANPSYAVKRKLLNNIRRLQADFVLIDLGAGSSSNVTDFFAAFPYSIVVLDNLPTSIENAYGFIKNGIIRGLLQLFPGLKEIQAFIHRAGSIGPDSFATVGEMLETAQRRYGNECRIMREWLASRKVFLILTMVKSADDVGVVSKFQGLIKKYLGIGAQYIGYVANLPEVRASIRELKPLVAMHDSGKARECYDAITRNLVALTKGKMVDGIH